MARRLIRGVRRWGLVSGVASPILVLQGGCTLDPDLVLRAAIQVFSETAIFVLENAAVALR